jgi:predicted dehydrogenase
MERIKFGVVGLSRGSAFVDAIVKSDDACLWAVCEKNPESMGVLDRCYPIDSKDTLRFDNFDEFLESGVEAVVLANYFDEHAKFAIRCMEKGIHVMSECTTAVTLKECVELCECVERTGCKYMIAENYPFTAANMEMERLVSEGKFGRILYGQGEYNHTLPLDQLIELAPGPTHWRAWMPRTYYLTHSLGPLMYITKQIPVSVSANAVHSDVLETIKDKRRNYDAFAFMDCKTDGGALFHFTGCAHIGSGSRYRIAGEYGGAEHGPGISGLLVSYHNWTVPEGEEQSKVYEPTWAANSELAANAGHGGGDFWTVYNFIQYIKNDIKPFFDVYVGAAMSAVAILGWYSCLSGKTYKIPDFKNVEERNKYRDNDLTPFPGPNGDVVTMPCSTKDAAENWKDLVIPDYE